MQNKYMDENKVQKIQQEIAELKGRWPAHSVPVSMWQQLEELEEKLDKVRNERLETDDSN